MAEELAWPSLIDLVIRQGIVGITLWVWTIHSGVLVCIPIMLILFSMDSAANVMSRSIRAVYWESMVPSNNSMTWD
jgi:hypothetical protein